MYKFPCPHCGQRISAEENVAGTEVSCPACEQTLRAPFPQPPPPLPADAPAFSTPPVDGLPPSVPAAVQSRGCLKWGGIGCGALLVLLIVAGIIGAILKPSGPSLPPNAEPASAPTPAAPVETISWREIEGIYSLQSKQTDLRKNEEWKRFKGKTVAWSGTVSAVSDGFTGLTLQVKMNPATFTSDLIIKLKRSEREKAIKLQQGDHVSFTGKLESWGTIMPISLEDGLLR